MGSLLNNEIILEGLGYIIYLLVSLAIYYTINFLKKKVDEQKLKLDEYTQEKIRMIITDGIRYAQQVYRNSSGEKRLEEALNYVYEKLEKMGLDIPDNSIRIILESILKDLKRQFGEDW